MSAADETDRRLVELLKGVTDGELGPDDQQQLNELLREDPEARQKYLDHIHLHAMLHWVESAPPIPAAPRRVPPERRVVPPLEFKAPAGSRFGFPAHPLRFAAAVATITVMAWLLLIALVSTDSPRLAEERAAGKPPLVARITGLVDCRWKNDRLGPVVGQDLCAGQRLEVESGTVEVTFRQGTRVVLEGPASLLLTNPNAGLLESGRLAASVPPEAVGFTVTTPSAVVVDLSTEFAVQVRDQDVTDVHVFHGQVQVTQLADLTNLDTQPEQVVEAHQALRVHGRDGEMMPLKLDPEQRRMLLARKRYIAYRNWVVAEGQQAGPECLGHDFIVNRPVVVTQLGTFDSGADGLKRPITVELWSRDDRGTADDFTDDQPLAKLATLRFTPNNPGKLFESSRFKPLPARLALSPGAYTIVAYGYGEGEPFGNSKDPNDDLYKSLEDGDGALSFVGTGRHGRRETQSSTTFPLTVGMGPQNRYRAGTFEFEVPEQPTAEASEKREENKDEPREAIAAPESEATPTTDTEKP